MKTRVLTVCNGGSVRSVTLADVLKGTHGYEAMSASAYWLSRDTMLMLCRWADLILPVDVRDCTHLPERDGVLWRQCAMWDPEFDAKRRVFEIGKDVWGHAQHPGLVAFIHAKINLEGLPRR